MSAEERSKWIVIGISGVTCGGKTSLAGRLEQVLVPVCVFHQDAYFYPDDSPRHVRCEGLPHNNYDVLSALDMAAMRAHVRAALRAPPAPAPARPAPAPAAPRQRAAPGKGFLILEGFTVLNDSALLELCDLRYYLVLEYGECAARRCRRLYDPPDVDGYFEQVVWPEHLRYRAQIEKDNRIKILDGTNHSNFDIVLEDLAALGVEEIS